MKNEKGFTLVELLVAMTIAVILMALSLVSYQGARKSARDGKRRADLEEIRSALEMCRTDTGVYPVDQDAIYPGVNCGSAYLEETPADPSSGARYWYQMSGDTYILCASLEMGGSDDCGATVRQRGRWLRGAEASSSQHGGEG